MSGKTSSSSNSPSDQGSVNSEKAPPYGKPQTPDERQKLTEQVARGDFILRRNQPKSGEKAPANSDAPET